MDEIFKNAQAHRKMMRKLKSNMTHVRSMVATGDIDAAMAIWDDALAHDDSDTDEEEYTSNPDISYDNQVTEE